MARCNAPVVAARSLSILLLFQFAACSSAPAPEPATKEQILAWRPATPHSPLVLNDEKRSPNVLSTLPAGTRIEFPTVPRVTVGIPMPDGTCLPALNGVIRSGLATRPAAVGAMPRVVGLAVDRDRFEWYEHIDGSMTTSRWVWRADQARWDAVTFHAVAKPK